MKELYPGPEPETYSEGMEPCQITGKLTPSADMIEFRGFRVCAEGKQEIMRRLRAGLALPGELETASVWARAVAYFIDIMIILSFNLAFGFLAGHNPFSEPLGQPIPGLTGDTLVERFRYQGAVQLFFCAVSLCYLTFFHARWGQTPGKMAVRIIVLDMEGAPITFKRALSRALWYTGITLSTPMVALILPQPDKITVYVMALTFIISVWGLVDTIVALADSARRRSLHDRLAGTQVVVRA